MNEYLNPSTLAKPVNNTYSQVTTTTAKKTVYVAGQVAWDKEGNVVGVGDLRAQTKQALDNVRPGLEAVGAKVKDIVRIRYYVINYSLDQVPDLVEPVMDFFDGASAPASSLIGVSALMYPDTFD
jgi:enamine deaminase RidA (YjgF/YER057c/UK114 family)